MRKQALGGLLAAMGPGKPTNAHAASAQDAQHGVIPPLGHRPSACEVIDTEAWRQFWSSRRELHLPDRCALLAAVRVLQ